MQSPGQRAYRSIQRLVRFTTPPICQKKATRLVQLRSLSNLCVQHTSTPVAIQPLFKLGLSSQPHGPATLTEDPMQHSVEQEDCSTALQTQLFSGVVVLKQMADTKLRLTQRQYKHVYGRVFRLQPAFLAADYVVSSLRHWLQPPSNYNLRRNTKNPDTVEWDRIETDGARFMLVRTETTISIVQMTHTTNSTGLRKRISNTTTTKAKTRLDNKDK